MADLGAMRHRLLSAQAEYRYLLVEEDNVRLPDFVGENANDADAAEVSRLPDQLVIIPQLQQHTGRSKPVCFIFRRQQISA